MLHMLISILLTEAVHTTLAFSTASDYIDQNSLGPIVPLAVHHNDWRVEIAQEWDVSQVTFPRRLLHSRTFRNRYWGRSQYMRESSIFFPRHSLSTVCSITVARRTRTNYQKCTLIVSQPIDYETEWSSAYADGGKVKWTKAHSVNGALNISFPDIRCVFKCVDRGVIRLR